MENFGIGATYWPRRKGALLWAEWDRGEVREELQQLAAIGMDTVRLPLHWEEFQPRPERIETRSLRALEQTLDLASDAGLRVVPGLMPLAVAGAIHLPSWATAASYAADMMMTTKFGTLRIVYNAAPPPLVWSRTKHTTEVRDLWTNPAMREAQRKLIAEVVGYFGDHPVLQGWELGSGIELARAPSSSDAAAEWLGETADVAREHGARGALFYAATLRSLTRRDGPRPHALRAARVTPVISVVPPEPVFGGELLTADALVFVATLLQALGGDPPVLLLGAPAVANAGDRVFADRAYGRAIEQPLLDHDGYARLVEDALPALQAAGSRGVWFTHAFCYPDPFVPEGAHSQRERMMGLFDTSGDELPVAGAISRFAAQPASDVATNIQSLDVEDYWNDPAASFRRLWGQWQTRDKQ
jgi:hypothetical protein